MIEDTHISNIDSLSIERVCARAYTLDDASAQLHGNAKWEALNYLEKRRIFNFYHYN